MLNLKKSFNKFDPIAVTQQMTTYLPQSLPIPKDGVRRRVLDLLLNVGIPFNRWLGLKIKELTPERVVIESPETILRRNHVGTAHACAQALIGEYTAGLLIAQKFPVESYRFIIAKLEIEYTKAGVGTLFGTAMAPSEWPVITEEQGWVEMETQITNKKGEMVSICRTRWQVKAWNQVSLKTKA